MSGIELTVDYRDEHISLTAIFFDHRRAFAEVVWNKAKSVVTCADHIGKRPPFEASNVYMAMMSCAQNGLCKASHETLGLKIGFKRNFVLQQCKVLELLGWAIKVQQGGKNHNPTMPPGTDDVCHYMLTQPDWSRKPERKPRTPQAAPPLYSKNTPPVFKEYTPPVSKEYTKRPLGVCTKATGERVQTEPSPPPSASPKAFTPHPDFQRLFVKVHGHEIIFSDKDKALYREAEDKFADKFLAAWNNYLADKYWHAKKHPLKGFVSQATNWMPAAKQEPKAVSKEQAEWLEGHRRQRAEDEARLEASARARLARGDSPIKPLEG